LAALVLSIMTLRRSTKRSARPFSSGKCDESLWPAEALAEN
jgi:hypothetical protein